MAVGVGEDDVAALLRQVHSGVVAGLVLGDVVAEDHLGVGRVVGVGRDAQLFAGGGEALDVGRVVAGVDVVDADQADLHIRGAAAGLLSGGVICCVAGVLLTGAAAGHQAQRHDQGQQQCKELLHSAFLLKNKFVQGTKENLSTAIIQGWAGKFNRIFTFFSRMGQKITARKRLTFVDVHKNHRKKEKQERGNSPLLMKNRQIDLF